MTSHIIKWRKKTKQVWLINGSFRNYNSVDSSNEIKKKGEVLSKMWSGPAAAPLIEGLMVTVYIKLLASLFI